MPALSEAKDTEKINWHLFMRLLFKRGVILWENTFSVFTISTEKSENCQLSDSFKEDVSGLFKLNAT